MSLGQPAPPPVRLGLVSVPVSHVLCDAADVKTKPTPIPVFRPRLNAADACRYRAERPGERPVSRFPLQRCIIVLLLVLFVFTLFATAAERPKRTDIAYETPTEAPEHVALRRKIEQTLRRTHTPLGSRRTRSPRWPAMDRRHRPGQCRHTTHRYPRHAFSHRLHLEDILRTRAAQAGSRGKASARRPVEVTRSWPVVHQPRAGHGSRSARASAGAHVRLERSRALPIAGSARPAAGRPVNRNLVTDAAYKSARAIARERLNFLQTLLDFRDLARELALHLRAIRVHDIQVRGIHHQARRQ